MSVPSMGAAKVDGGTVQRKAVLRFDPTPNPFNAMVFRSSTSPVLNLRSLDVPTPNHLFSFPEPLTPLSCSIAQAKPRRIDTSVEMRGNIWKATQKLN
ncbi:hypothetical protein B296_00006931 [Ensete ventricosum]|uniref:Uncharacterized protein n=1 Tax=Ensete ventricosum TaxID=4639 RepID=A0A427BBD8_ENSVE|nr:hypothetical protein B296_00006931 [Ensete ventricosum]